MDNFFVCRVAIAPLRHEPSDRAEIVSQLLFGDRVIVLEKTEKWWLVQTRHDSYQGWMDFKQLQKISQLQFGNEDGHELVAPLSPANELEAQDGTSYYLPAGSTIPFCENGECCLGEHTFKLHFEPLNPSSTDFLEKIESTAKFFLNAPYLWGGRTLFGIDCSGFSQIVYKILGLKLRRDASQQAEQGVLVDFLSASQKGDLAFFDNEEGKITHVGIMIGNDKIIHASGKVRIDPVDNQGIYNTELGRYTHKLRIIKRFI